MSNSSDSDHQLEEWEDMDADSTTDNGGDTEGSSLEEEDIVEEADAEEDDSEEDAEQQAVEDEGDEYFNDVLHFLVIQKQASNAMKVKTIASRNSLKKLCIYTVLKNLDFYAAIKKTQQKNPFLILPESLLHKLREYYVANEHNEYSVGCAHFSMMIHPSSITSVRFGNCKEALGLHFGCRLYCSSMPTQEALHKTSNLQQISFIKVQPYKNFHDGLLKLEKLQVIDIPNLKCDDRQLVLFAVYLTNLRVLSVTLDVSEVFSKGALALSRLEHFRNFTFAMHYRGIDTKGYTNAQDLMQQCLQLMPWLKRLGHESDEKLLENIWEITHPLKSLERPTELALEALVLRSKIEIPENCTFSNLQELYLFGSDGDVSELGKLKELSHLSLTRSCDFDKIEKILKLIGRQMTSLHLQRVPGVKLERIFQLCPTLKKLIVDSDFYDQHFGEEATVPESMTRIKLAVIGPEVEFALLESPLLTKLLLASNHTLKSLEFKNIYVGNGEIQRLIGLVEQKMILQAVEKLVFSALRLNRASMPKNGVVALQFLAACVTNCPKLLKIKCLDDFDEDLFKYDLEKYWLD